MTDTTDELIREIAVQHGIAIDRDDPIMVLQTINKRLAEETRTAQEKLLLQFKEELEASSKRWSDDTKLRAERILNASLTASKETMTEALRQAAVSAQKITSDEINSALIRLKAHMVNARTLTALNMISSLILLSVACVLLWRTV